MSIVGACIVPHPPIILPEIGKGEEHHIQATINAYSEAVKRIIELQPDTIVITSPHSIMYADYFHISPGKHAKGNMRQFHAGSLTEEADYDVEFVQALSQLASENNFPAGTFGERDPLLDHGTFIPLHFLHTFQKSFKIVRIGLSGLSPLEHYKLGKLIAQAAGQLNRRTALIASGDLSHKLTPAGPYGYTPEGPQFDSQITQAMANCDFLSFLTFPESFSDAAAECGLRSFQILAGALDGKSLESDLLSYEGPFGVGYAVCSFKIMGDDPSRHFDQIYLKQLSSDTEKHRESEDEYVQLARLSLETYLKTGVKMPCPEHLSKPLISKQAGVFVSLKKEGRLRGCIGTIEPATNSIAEEIIRNAVSAGTEDPRFPPVSQDECKLLIYSVDVLNKPEPVSSLDDLDVSRYGVIVANGGRRGLLLPNLDGVTSSEQQVSIALKKAGISEYEPYSMQRFEVIRHI